MHKWGQRAVDRLFRPVDMSRYRILVFTPILASLPPEVYANHIVRFQEEFDEARSTGLRIHFRNAVRTSIVSARNAAVREALDGDFTHLFFLDDDVILPPRAISRLVEHDRDVASGLTFLRTPPHYPAMFLDPHDASGVVHFIKTWPLDQVIEVDAVGTACVLIKTSVLKHLESEGPDAWFQFAPGRIGEAMVGEDIHFSKRVRDAGFRIFVDTAMEFGHLGRAVVYRASVFQELMAERGAGAAGIDYRSYSEAHAQSVALVATPSRAVPTSS